ncbi:hypothetical protein ABN16_12130 [Levilactobacillus koreensis]|uniref:Uncharacterized protein n=1 Tax=Levilactobacillus koreensis TaxID=637971 RepID=A0AAC8UWE2_9LACO|nr:hypothetical protein ABN16_12130 [Levilactobacillus koreensis]
MAMVMVRLVQGGTTLETCVFHGFKASRKPVSQAEGVPHGRRNPWQPERGQFPLFYTNQKR